MVTQATSANGQRTFSEKSARHLHRLTDNAVVLTRNRAELRERIAGLNALHDAAASDASKKDGDVAPAGLAPRTGLAPHIDRTVKLDFGFLVRQAEQLTAASTRKLVRAAERRIPRRPDQDLTKRLADLAPGDTTMVPFHALRPGQAQLSLTHAGTKVAKFLRKLDGHTPEDLTALAGDLGLLEVPCLIGPGGRFAVMHDRHHHMSGLLALIGWTDNLTNKGHALHMGKPGPELATLHALFGHGVPHVQIKVTENLSHLSEAEFLDEAKPYLHRQMRNGELAEVLPTRFADLEDNPFRFLASQTKIKVERTGEGKRDFALETKGGASALWVKPPSAPDFVEFHIGKIFAAAFADAGRTYDPTVGLQDGDVEHLQNALLAAQADETHPSHEVLQSIVVKPAQASVEDFKDDIKVGRKTGHVRLK